MNRPAKPYPEFPLYAHACGWWAKRINGKTHYFGQWRKVSWRDALHHYQSVRDALHAGRDPSEYNAGITVKYLCNAFLESRLARLESGELTQRTYDDYYRTCGQLLDQFTKTRTVTTLGLEDFSQYRAQLAKRLGMVALGNEIRRVRTVFKYAYDTGLITSPIRFGPDFAPPSARHRRIERANRATRLFTAEEIRTLLDHASEPLHTMILLGINCALGNADCGRLLVSHLDLRGGWLDYPRPKTGIPRTSRLWPRTVKHLRPFTRSKPRQALVFRTKFGQSWHKESRVDNPIAKEFRKVMIAAKVHRTGRGFYSLRHTFQTEAGAALDPDAVHWIMGHEPEHTSSAYRHNLHAPRLTAISDHLHAWLFTCSPVHYLGEQ